MITNRANGSIIKESLIERHNLTTLPSLRREGIHPVKSEVIGRSNLKSVKQHMHHGYYLKPVFNRVKGRGDPKGLHLVHPHPYPPPSKGEGKSMPLWADRYQPVIRQIRYHPSH